MPILNIKKLNKFYGGIHALKDISISINKGEILGIIGGNGAGKSSLVKSITGAEKIDNGTIEFDGKDISDITPYSSKISGIEMVYQDLNICPQFDVVSNIFLGQEIKKFGGMLLDYGAMHNKAEEIINNINSDIDIRKNAGELSGGQQQAIAIARALIGNPKLLIMDEPTASLGVSESNKVINLIKSINKSGITIIIISHRIQDLFKLSDRLAIMEHGRLKSDVDTKNISIDDVMKQMMME